MSNYCNFDTAIRQMSQKPHNEKKFSIQSASQLHYSSDVVLNHGDAILLRIGRALTNLAFNGFFALTVSGIAGVDHGSHGRHLSFMHQWTVECSFQSNISYNVYTMFFILLQ